MDLLAGQTAALAGVVAELGLPATVLSPLLAHASAVREHADRLGLVSLGDIDSIVSRHTADSLLFALARAPRKGERWVDVGSGAGFPGLVLACCYPAVHFSLVEPQRRRAGFLELQCARLGLDNAVVEVKRAAQVEPGFDVGVARALADPAEAIERLRLLAPTGALIVAVGSMQTVLPGAALMELVRPGVDSPGRLLMMPGKEEDRRGPNGW